MIILAVACFVTAALYASVGFGGGSTYNALLVISGTDYRTLPIIALACNLIVVCGGIYKYFRTGHLDIRRVLPWVITSVPAALIGGYIPVSEKVFVGILGISLGATGLRLLFQRERRKEEMHGSGIVAGIFLAPVTGGALGLLSGMAGIGGGIFLAPVLHFMRGAMPGKSPPHVAFLSWLIRYPVWRGSL